MEKTTTTNNVRLKSLDALRGFDMLWIMGGGEIFIALAALTGLPVLKWWAEQQEHVAWQGFRFEDMIFPLFLFIAGISFPFSMAKRYLGTENRKALYSHVIKRGLILVLLGIIYNNAINFDFANMRYASVLARIGLAWMFGALIFMNTNLRGRIIWFCSILIGYWVILLLFKAHDLGEFDRYSPQGCIVGYIDRLLLPGRFCCYTYGDNEGLISVIPAIGTALLGMLTGQFLQSGYLSSKPYKKILYMAATAIALMLLGKVWDIWFPIIKNIWSSSFVLFVGGLSLLVFTLFHLIIDIWKFERWTFFFVVIGMNSITVYLAQSVINFQHTAKFLFGGFINLFPTSYAELLGALAYVATVWIFLYILYKKKIFLKV